MPASPPWLRQCSPPASPREGARGSRARERAGTGADGTDRRAAEQSFFVTPWDFSLDGLPEPLVFESLLLHDSAERVILAGCRWW